MDPNNVNPTIPTAPAMPEALAAPVTPAAPAMPTMPEMPAPVNPVVNPTGVHAVEPTAPATSEPVATPTIPEIPTPVSPVFQPGNPMVGATDPITMPNPPKELDPIEEELKAPMKAAGPVPGSIGSAISMPSEQVPAGAAPQMGPVPNVAFNDPATQQQLMPQGVPMSPAKKKMDKKTLIMLCALAGVVVVALAVVLVMQMM